MACSLNGLTVEDSIPINMDDLPSKYSPMSEDSDETNSPHPTLSSSHHSHTFPYLHDHQCDKFENRVSGVVVYKGISCQVCFRTQQEGIDQMLKMEEGLEQRKLIIIF
ncbi:unnamed protein product [Arabis nemorensis]|uniref:Uncharacterized protein n=1 Tax=Arabis nemorensis TaxID=586526 RepID=A0A565AZL7_9BRAS|nr:unnamed protein product [Arabis nemorensis]